MDWSDFALAGLSVLLVFLGAALTIGVEVVRGQLERTQRRQDRRDDFQRETLIELQESLYKHGRSFATTNLDYENLQAGKLPVSLLWGEDHAKEGRHAGFRIVVLSQRVSDPKLREILDRYKATVREDYSNLVTLEQGKAWQRKVESIFMETNDRIGELLRPL